MRETGYWLITVAVKHCSGFSTLAIDQHPARYMAENMGEEWLIFAMPITKAHFKAIEQSRL
jgi:hypothetical protein